MRATLLVTAGGHGRIFRAASCQEDYNVAPGGSTVAKGTKGQRGRAFHHCRKKRQYDVAVLAPLRLDNTNDALGDVDIKGSVQLKNANGAITRDDRLRLTDDYRDA
jgi:hypothetical protein